MHLYFAFQTDGYLFDVTRTDGLSFFAPTLPPVEEPSFFDMVEEELKEIRDWLAPSAP